MIARFAQNALIIGSDQTVVLGERILGKPGNHENAVRQLSEMSGQCVVFLTGIALLNSATGYIQVDIVPYTVHFRTLTAAQIENYLRKEPAYQCAGSFKSEALGVALMERMEGDDPSALIGLPLIRLIRMLEAEGLNIL
jgi:septum formation protein